MLGTHLNLYGVEDSLAHRHSICWNSCIMGSTNAILQFNQYNFSNLSWPPKTGTYVTLQAPYLLLMLASPLG